MSDALQKEIMDRHDGTPVCDALCVSRRNEIFARLEAMDTALQVKTDENDRRLAALNELRSEVTKDREQFVRTEIYNIKANHLEEGFQENRRRIDSIETKSSSNVRWITALFAFTQLAVLIILHFWK